MSKTGTNFLAPSHIYRMAYYLIAVSIPLLLSILFLKKKRFYAAVFYAVNLSALTVFVYDICLAVYFYCCYMTQLDEYPSAVISQWWVLAFLYFVLPLDAIYLAVYLKKKFAVTSRH